MARLPKLHIIIDTREKTPFVFRGHHISLRTLKDGDYTLYGYTKWIRVERKSYTDFLYCLRRKAARLEDQLNRLCAYDYPLLVIEGRISMKSWWSPLDTRTKAGIVSRLLATYPIQIMFCDTPEIANYMTLRFMTYAKEAIDKGSSRSRKAIAAKNKQEREARLF